MTSSELDWIRKTGPLVARLESVLAKPALLGLLRPLDLERHRARFLADWEAGSPQDPVFEYVGCDGSDFDDLAEVIGAASRFEDPWHRLLAEEAEAVLVRFQALASHEAKLVTEATAAENTAPDATLLADALGLLAQDPESTRHPESAQDTGSTRQPLLDAEAAARVFTNVLRDNGLDDWTVRLDPEMAAGMAVLSARRLVSIRPDVQVPAETLLRLAVHEIGTHVFRWENARRGAALLCLQLSGHSGTEEGFATWHEMNAVPGAVLHRRFPLRVVAVDAALRGGFVEVVRELTAFTEVRSAFEIAVRAKRGLIDTAAPGGFVKDHVYLGGLREVERYLAAAPGDYDLLMSSKWPLRRQELLKAAGAPWATQRPLRTADESFVAGIRSSIAESVSLLAPHSASQT